MNDKPQAEINTLLYAVAPNPKLSTDAIALDGAVVSRGNGIGATSETYLMDCIVGMKHYPDKYFDLAVVDPPYGIGADNLNMAEYQNGKKLKNGWTKKATKYKKGNWDNEQPKEEYWVELFRVSKKQIIWGGNHFNLGPSRGYIIWDKLVGFEFSTSMCEMAWTNCINNVKKFTYQWSGFVQGPNGNIRENRIHPTQKPVALYDFVFKNYSEPGQKVIDTHLGSGSSRISAHKYGLNFTGFEIDEDYFFGQDARFRDYQSQLTIF